MSTRVGNFETNYSVRGISSFQIELWHDGLKKHRLIKGADSTIVRRKADLQSNEWDEKWAGMQEKETNRLSRETKKQTAVRKTEEAQKELERLGNILRHTLEINDAINWETLKTSTPFPESKPKKTALAAKPTPKEAPVEPRRTQPKFGILDKIFASRREKIENECNNLFKSDHVAWKHEIAKNELEHAGAEKGYEEALLQAESSFQGQIKKWQAVY